MNRHRAFFAFLILLLFCCSAALTGVRQLTVCNWTPQAGVGNINLGGWAQRSYNGLAAGQPWQKAGREVTRRCIAGGCQQCRRGHCQQNAGYFHHEANRT